MNAFHLKAPAKLNLSLRVLSKRDDGFHEIDTVMVKLPELADKISFEPADSFSFHCSDPTVPNDERNLVVKAVRAYESATDAPCNCTIYLHKVIPHGAGLGGGSSDAATTLLGLNRLNNFSLNVEQLHSLAASIGSDVPFFLSAGASRCTGRGEIITPIPSPKSHQIILLKPNFPVPTADAYGRWKQSFKIPTIPYDEQIIDDLHLINDLERPVFEKHRFLAELKLWLLSRPEVSAAMMSGSGSTVFAILKDPATADTLATAARTELDPTLWSWSGNTET